MGLAPLRLNDSHNGVPTVTKSQELMKINLNMDLL